MAQPEHLVDLDKGEIPDEKLKYLILGIFRGMSAMEEFPLKVSEVIDNFDEDGTIESFTIVTFSGLRYTVHCTYDGDS